MIEQYLAPINPDKLGYHASGKVTTLGSKINAYIQSMPPMPQNSIVIVGVGEDRGAVCNAGCAEAPDDIRHSLYTLALPCEEAQITDIGNVIQGQYVEDTYCALAEIAAEVMRHGNTLIILGGSQDLTFAAYKGFEQLDRIISIAAIDPCFDLEENDEITSRTWLRNIIMQSPNFLFRSSRRSNTCARIERSSALTASSHTRSSGFAAIARAMQMRWRCPPENSWGYLSKADSSRPTSARRV